MTTPTTSETAQRMKSSREAKLADMRGGVITYAASPQPEIDGGDRARPSGHPDRDRDRAEQRRVDDLVAEAEERLGDEHADGADREAERHSRDDAADVRPEVADGRPLGGLDRIHSHSLHARSAV